MENEKVKKLVEWLYAELECASKEIRNAREKKAFDSEARNEGKADAILRIIKRLRYQ